MIRDPLERRRDPRTQAHLPIMFRIEGDGEITPAHLVDLSAGGAALVTTAYNAPIMGQYLELQFESANNNEDGDPVEVRNETALVVNMRTPERGISRLGVRFVQKHGLGSDMFDPRDVLSDHRKISDTEVKVDRWDPAKNFETLRKTRDRETAGAC
ncbi:MAG: PilZ domain-containing protein [Planctomycetes bacterium]|nr:PilZ domain-containing protein [Planctomycetota bacterium]